MLATGLFATIVAGALVIPETAGAQQTTARTCIATISTGSGNVTVLRKIGPKQDCPNGETLYTWERTGFAWKDAWDSTTTYKQNDAVSLGGTSYLSLIDDNLNNDPDSSPSAWAILALQGADGATGADGDDGATGPTGADGVTGPTGDPGSAGPTGPTGADGTNGSTGPTGPTGDDGAVGATGPPGAGAILSSSSGDPAVATTIIGGTPGTVTVLPPSGSRSETGVSIVGGTIDLTGITAGQPVARDGTITSVAGFSSLTVAQNLVGTTVTQTISVWQSTTPDNVYTMIPGTEVTLAPSLTGVLSPGTIASGILTGLSVPVTAGTNLIVVYAVSATGLSLINVTTADVSASVSIS